MLRGRPTKWLSSWLAYHEVKDRQRQFRRATMSYTCWHRPSHRISHRAVQTVSVDLTRNADMQVHLRKSLPNIDSDVSAQEWNYELQYTHRSTLNCSPGGIYSDGGHAELNIAESLEVNRSANTLRNEPPFLIQAISNEHRLRTGARATNKYVEAAHTILGSRVRARDVVRIVIVPF